MGPPFSLNEVVSSPIHIAAFDVNVLQMMCSQIWSALAQ